MTGKVLLRVDATTVEIGRMVERMGESAMQERRPPAGW
jgi:hypothetical protein